MTSVNLTADQILTLVKTLRDTNYSARQQREQGNLTEVERVKIEQAVEYRSRIITALTTPLINESAK